MDLKEFIEKTEKAIQNNNCITFMCECEVNYEGRAQAHLPRGDRIFLIKEDNTLLIHQPKGGPPINYLREKSKIEMILYDKYVLLKCSNQKYKDKINAEIFKVYNFTAKALDDGKKQILVGNERDMANMIYDNPEIIEKGFKPLSREEHTKYGFIDVFGHDNKGNLVIVECKRYTASLQCVTQLRRYVEKMKKVKGIENVRGIMASPSISPNAKQMLEDWGFSWKHVHPPKRLENYRKDQKKLDGWD